MQKISLQREVFLRMAEEDEDLWVQKSIVI